MEKYYNFDDYDICIQVTNEGSPFKLRFYSSDSYEEYRDDEKEELVNEDKIAPQVSPNGADFLSSQWWQDKLSKRLTESSLSDFTEDEADEIIEKFVAVAGDELEKVAKEGMNEEKRERKNKVDDTIDEKAENLLTNPSLVLRIDDAIHEEMAIENRNAMLDFIVCVSAKNKGQYDPVNLDWSGRTSTGKTRIAITPLEFFPEDMVMDYIGMSEKSLYHDGEQIDENTAEVDFNNKILVVLEKENSREALQQLKPILSHDKKEHVYKYAKEAGETVEVIMKGWPVFIGCTVEHEEDEELDTRSITGTPEIGEEKYRSVIDWKAKKNWAPWEDGDTDETKRVIRRAVEKLDPTSVWIPYIPELRRNFPDVSARHQRDWDRLVSLISATAILHQYQRDSVEADEEEYLVATPYDALVALDVLQGVLEQSMLGLERDIIEFYEELQERNKKEGSTISWTYNDLQEVHNDVFDERISYTQVRRRFVKPLKEIGAVRIDDSTKPHEIEARRMSLSARFPHLDKMVKEVRDFEYGPEMIKDRFFEASKARGDNPGPELNILSCPSLNFESLENVYGEFKRRIETSTEGQEIDWHLGESEPEELDSLIEEDNDDEGETSQRDRLKEVMEFYKERYQSEIPYLGDFVTTAADVLEEKVDTIKKDCEHLKENGKLTFKKEKLDDF